jgi:pimeloyl-ACP methyl ester carboxylesterase
MTPPPSSVSEARTDDRPTPAPIVPLPWAVAAPGGRSVAGVRLGVPEGRRALFVHGVPASSENVRYLDLSGRAIAAAGVSMVAVDRPGVGLTDRSTVVPADPAAAARAAADDMAAVLDALGWERATVVVHSAGAYAGVTMAARHADRVARLVLVAGAAPDMGAPEAAGMDSDARALFDLCRDRPNAAAWVMRAMRAALAVAPGPATRAAAKSLPPADRALLSDVRASRAFVAMVRRALARGPGGVVVDARAARGPWPVDVTAVTCPVDLYAGGEDRNVPPSVAEAWARRFPDARIERLAGAGHVSILPAVAEAVLASIP